jgi:hypothetical protein
MSSAPQRPAKSRTRSLPPGLLPALERLLEAHDLAPGPGRGLWDFAVEIGTLHSLGATDNGLRWFVNNLLAEHAREIKARHRHRSFHVEPRLAFDPRTAFILTEAGVALARHVCKPARGAGRRPAKAVVPHWDEDRSELSFAGHVVKRYKQPAPHQKTVLRGFEKDGWPSRQPNPLPAEDGVVPRQRLHDTITGLNQHQRAPLLHFFGDGSGRAVCWERSR